MELEFSTNSLIALFLLYLIILGNFTADVLGCRIQELFTEIPAAKHIVCFFSLYYFINLTSPEKMDPNKTLRESFVMYILFLVSRDIPFTYIILSLMSMFIIKYLEDYTVYHYKTVKDKESKTYKRLKLVQKTLTVVILILFLFGFVKYTLIQRKDHRDNWNWYHYIVGKPNYVCHSLKDKMTLGSQKGRLNFRKALQF